MGLVIADNGRAEAGSTSRVTMLTCVHAHASRAAVMPTPTAASRSRHPTEGAAAAGLRRSAAEWPSEAAAVPWTSTA